ncbi:MAG: hypothetical protein JNK64_27750, partial [Myxococcales bacterium]|nr:hypothetical protein [Myxococcales bacterium]
LAALVDVLERTPRRRRLAAIVGGAVVASGAAVVAAAALARAPARVDCARTGAIAERTWTAARRAAIADPHARDDLDRWAGRWREQRVDACRATHERGEQSAAVLDRRVACLDATLIGFAALADALGHADVAAARRAGEAIARLPAPEACSALRVAGLAPPRRDPRADAVEQRLAAARAAVELRTPDARAAADRALADARALGEPGPLARALAIHAEAIGGVDAAASRAEFDQAQAAAAAARDPALEAAVVLRGVAQSAATANAADRIDALLPVARAAVTRAGEPRPLQYELAQVEVEAAMRLARVDELRAACARATELAPAEDAAVARATCACSAALLVRDNAGAITACADKTAALRARVGDDHPRVADALHNQLTALVRAERLTEAAAAKGDYLALIERLYGARSREQADALQLAGVLQERQGDLKASRATLERALAIVEEVGGPADPGRVGLLLELATRAGDLGDVAAATRYADAGLAASERLLGADNPDLAVYLVFHAKAVGADPAQLARAIASWDRALAVAERSGARTFTMGSILSSYAWFLAHHDRAAAALALAQRSLPIFDELGEALAAARAQNLIGELLLELRRSGDARAALTDARARFVRLGPDVADELAEVDRSLARAR